MAEDIYSRSVFINCPFDGRYKPMFDAIVFAVVDCGYVPRCARENHDAGVIRIHWIFSLISRCRFGLNDISRTGLDSAYRLPRFNMPLELGIFLAAQHYGKRKKVCLIFDKEKHRYQKFISDIAGQDINIHDGSPEQAVAIVRNWLRAPLGKRVLIPGGEEIWRRYQVFRRQLPASCKELKLEHRSLIFEDYCLLAEEWCSANDF